MAKNDFNLPFVPAPGKSPSGYEVRNFPTSAATPGRYSDSFPTVSGQVPLQPSAGGEPVKAPVGSQDESVNTRGRRGTVVDLKNQERQIVQTLGAL